MSTIETLVLLGVLLCAAAAGAELLARAWIRRRGEYFVLQPNSRTLMRVDRETLPQLEPEVALDVNQDGERGSPPPRDWRDTYRVLVAGGSAAECFLLDQESSWPHVLETRLGDAAARLGARAVHVGNIARSLVACEYIETMLRRVLPRYSRLDLVVLMVGASDVVAWLEKKTPARIEEGRIPSGALFQEHPEGPFGWTLSSLALRQVIASWHRRVAHPVTVRSGAGKTLAKNRAMRARSGERIDVVPDPAPMLAYFEKYLKKTIATARASGARVLVVRQPWLRKDFTPAEDALLWNFGAGRPYEEEVKAYYSHRVVNELMGAVDALAARVAEENGAEHVELMSRLEHNFETFYDRLHFTPKGAQRVGEIVAEAVLEPRTAAVAQGS